MLMEFLQICITAQLLLQSPLVVQAASHKAVNIAL